MPARSPLWAFALLSVAAEASACKCADPGSYDLVFRGEVLSTFTESHHQRERFGSTDTHFRVIETLDGESRRRVHVHSEAPGFCGVSFEQGKTYVVYAKRYGDIEGLFETKYCYGRARTPPAGPAVP